MTPDSHQDARRSAWPAAGLYFVLVLLMNVPYLGMTPLAETEGHRALTGHEMARSGQWLVPMLYGRPYLAKPPLHYWIIATAESAARAAARSGGGPSHDRLIANIEKLVGLPNVFIWRMPSAIEGGLLCAVVCLFAARWFGQTAGWVAGASALGMIALWGEHQVTDIDVTNTLCATIAALCGIEILFEQSGDPPAPPRPATTSHRRESWPWAMLAGMSIGGTLMTKGPAGLPIIVAVWGWAACTAMRGRASSRLAHPQFWAPPAIGLGLFAGYLLAARWFIQRHGLPIDTSGLHEGLQSLYPKTLRQVGAALLLPAYLLLYSMPVSLALPFWYLSRPVRGAMAAAQRDRSAAIAAAVPIAWVICLVSGMVNPRYGYPSLPLLCPLAGAVAVTAARLGGSAADWARRIAVAAAVALAGAAVFLSFSAWNISHDRIMAPAICAALAVIAAGVIAARISRSWSAAVWLLPMIVLASVPFGIRQSLARAPISGIHTARYINQIAGRHPRIVEGMGLTFRPEIFYYARANATAVIPNVFDPRHVHPGTWLYMDNHEHDRWKAQAGGLLNHDMLINLGGASTYYFAWYGQPDDPAAKLADNAPPVAPTARGRK